MGQSLRAPLPLPLPLHHLIQAVVDHQGPRRPRDHAWFLRCLTSSTGNGNLPVTS
jgi:hypothetical protein